MSITDTQTMPESKYCNTLMKRNTAFIHLEADILTIVVCSRKNVTYNNMKSTKVFKQIEQITSNSTIFG